MLEDRDLTLLMNTFLFQGCSLDETEALISRCSCRTLSYTRREVLFSPAHFRRELGILLDGRVQVTKRSGLVVSELTAGDLFGAAALFTDGADYVSTLIARTDCRVLFLTQDEVRQLIDRSRQVRYNYLSYLSGRIRFLSEKVETLGHSTGEQKLTAWLISNMGEDGIIRMPCTMTELCRRLNLGRTSLYRELTRLEEAGILTRGERSITVIRPDQLAARL